MSVKINDRIQEFGISARNQLDTAIMQSAVNILVASKHKAPFNKGGLRSDTETKRIVPMHWRVSYWKEYARFQEFGGDGKRIVRNYTTAGTGKKYLSTAGNNERENLIKRIKVYAERARA